MASGNTEKHTLTYRTVRGLDIQLDYILPERDADSGARKPPIVVWFHGGGLIQGSRIGVYSYPHLSRAPSKFNLCLVAADYRLAPQTRFPQILSDLTSLFSYISSAAFKTATDNRLDYDRIVVMGSSAGGWLSLLSGLKIGFDETGQEYDDGLTARLRGVVGLYPITTVEDKFWHEPQRRKLTLLYCRLDVIHNRVIDKAELKEFLDPKADEIQEGILQNLLLDGTNADPSAFTVAKAIRDKRTVSPLPPVYLVHGTADDKVPENQAVEVVEALRAVGHSEVRYERREGLNHSFDVDDDMDELWSWVIAQLG
ncbi:alpha/beta hydrolase [Sporobolomyces koalae]|uniref:alpha/beta hydrolase n=1 Tax=Sporobolomyces koalae TaxID=500713 RepID=UPI00317AD808